MKKKESWLLGTVKHIENNLEIILKKKFVLSRVLLVLQSGCLPMYSQLWDEWAPTSERGELLAFTLSGKPTGLLKIKLNLIITNTDMANLRLYFISLRS